MTEAFSAALRQNASINLWELGPVVANGLGGWVAPAEDRIRYAFRNGYTNVGDLPIRKIFRAEMVGRPIPLAEHWISDGYYLPQSNRRVEFNAFCFTPTHKRRWCRTTVVVPADGVYRFELGTCGGVRLWVGGEQQACFEPFIRNAEQRTQIGLRLSAGRNELVAHMEEIFERDTYWGFELKYLDAVPLEIQLDVPVEADHVASLQAVSASIHPSQDLYSLETLELVSDVAAARDFDVTVNIVTSGQDHTTIYSCDLVLRQGQSRLTLNGTSELPEGYHHVDLTFRLGPVAVKRRLAVALLHDPVMPDAPESLDMRKAEALDHAASFGDQRVGRVLAMLATGNVDPVALESIMAYTLTSIEQREDCSDFYIVVLLAIWGKYPERIPRRYVDRIRRAILGWRYWVDEPGNDVMWFWSENHTLCFHVAQYVAGHLFPNDTFACSGRTGAEQKALGAERLGLWLDSVEAHGFGEWNSAAYYPIDFIGLFGLLLWADGDLKLRTAGLIDTVFLMTGLHALDGVPSGSQGRAYDKELRAGPLNELAGYCRVAFGEGFRTSCVYSLPMFCISDYVPPALATKTARWEDDGGISARYVQGWGHAGRLVLYKERAAMLSTSMDQDTGLKGLQQHVLDVRLGGHPMARLWVNHPGEDDPWGSGRPAYWTGNGILPKVSQIGDTAAMIFDLGDKPERPFAHIFSPISGLVERIVDGQWFFASSGEGYAAIWCSSAIETITTGSTAGYEFRGNGLRTGWLVRVGSGRGTADFAAFRAQCLALAPRFDAEALTLLAGTLMLDWQEGTTLAGQPANFTEFDVTPRIEWGVSGALCLPVEH